MKAFFARGYGGPGEATFGELPDPVPGRGDVLVADNVASGAAIVVVSTCLFFVTLGCRRLRGDISPPL